MSEEYLEHEVENEEEHYQNEEENLEQPNEEVHQDYQTEDNHNDIPQEEAHEMKPQEDLKKEIEEGTSITSSNGKAHIRVGGSYVIDNINDINEVIFDNFDDNKACF